MGFLVFSACFLFYYFVLRHIKPIRITLLSPPYPRQLQLNATGKSGRFQWWKKLKVRIGKLSSRDGAAQLFRSRDRGAKGGAGMCPRISITDMVRREAILDFTSCTLKQRIIPA